MNQLEPQSPAPTVPTKTRAVWSNKDIVRLTQAWATATASVPPSSIAVAKADLAFPDRPIGQVERKLRELGLYTPPAKEALEPIVREAIEKLVTGIAKRSPHQRQLAKRYIQDCLVTNGLGPKRRGPVTPPNPPVSTPEEIEALRKSDLPNHGHESE